MGKEVPGRVFLGGHSYGGRQATMLAAAEPDLAPALLLLSYPLHPPKKPEQCRTAHFPNLRTPPLFVHGSRDGFGTIAEMTEALRLIPARTRLVPIASAGHELAARGKAADLAHLVVREFQMFLKEL
jgi:predicted alpha/beta-hydrolase family hydrolase